MLSGTSDAGFDADYAEWKSWDTESFGAYSKVDAAYYADEFKTLRPVGRRVLEIGFGNGLVLGWLKDRGAEAYGVEANPVLVERALRLLGPARAFSDLGDARLSALVGTFDHVIALDVLEHVPMSDIAPLLSRVKALLAPGGYAVFRFPNGESPFGRMNQHGDPTHVTVLGGERLRYFARHVGLGVHAVRGPALPVFGVGMARALRRCLIRGARGLIEPLIAQVYLGGRNVPLDPNCVVVLRRPPLERN
jgi:2-polyprenyl-3-methyl-5-hydroxy-6-metoxy-1,4-benzoquinol methylase